ncbi:hypothetical protein [Kribbella speibonae]|uniref:HEAT repeat domain-containing protein n=1 Tax=Kribbella speibonae TaxID=1572660 RepID=A0ABY2A2Y4_9ACTN|nr:hypothetical protein [Kribbella speibonae]TCC22764.1 hypothetical protein E0H58_20485 [Kribbella speibonae]
MELEADWHRPTVGKLPIERSHGYQLDLKDPEHDQPTKQFLDGLVQHSKNLRDSGSQLMMTVTTDLWAGNRQWTGPGVGVVELGAPPPAPEVVEAHLKAEGHAELLPYAEDPDAAEHIRGRDAVAAVRAVMTIIDQARHHPQAQSPLPHRDGTTGPSDTEPLPAVDASLRVNINTALSDWRNDLDGLFGEVDGNRSLSLKDRCLLLALAVRKTAPVAHLDEAGRALHERLIKDSGEQTGLTSSTAAIFGGKGLRSRLRELTATVDSRDVARLTKRGYGDAVVSYVWDNYAVTRDPILEWLVDGAGSTADIGTVKETLATLLTRHSGQDHLPLLRAAAVKANRADVVAAAMETIVADEHVGRAAWSALYTWAGQDSTALHGVVLAVCSNVLRNGQSAQANRQLALVRLRRLVLSEPAPVVKQAAWELMVELAGTPDGRRQLVAEVARWQQPRPAIGQLAFLALMELDENDGPMLLVGTPENVDVPHALRSLLTDRDQWPQIVPAVVRWFRACGNDIDRYGALRDLVLDTLRSGRSFDAGMSLMAQLNLLPAPDDSESTIGKQLWEQFVDPQLRPAFPLPNEPE